MSLRSTVVAGLFPLLAAFLAWAWAELAEVAVVRKGSNLAVFVALVLATGAGVGYSARRVGSRHGIVVLLVLAGMALAAAMCFFAMLYVTAQHGGLG